jgi:hypothetical protein
MSKHPKGVLRILFQIFLSQGKFLELEVERKAIPCFSNKYLNPDERQRLF